MSIGTKIRDLRKARGLTQEQVAAAIGVSKPAVSKWESNNGYPDITLLAPLARFFETTVDCLLEYNISITEKQIGEIIEKLQALLFSSDFEQAKKYADTLSIVRTGSNTPPASPNPPRRSCWSAWSCSAICVLRSIPCPKRRVAGWMPV